MHTAEPFVAERSYPEVEIAIEKLKIYKSPGNDEISAERFWSGGNTLCSEIHKLNSIWSVEDLPQHWRKYIYTIYEKGETNDCSNYRGISLLPTTYNILSSILLSIWTPYAEEIIRDDHCVFRSSRSTADQIFCIH